ncbi:MAG: hypothetical protein ACHQ5A_04895 [Opitutales bacterium]
MDSLHPEVRSMLELAGLFCDLAEIAAREIRQATRRPRPGSYATRRPGADTPMWNVCVVALRAELRPYGTKVRLARYLGIPRQRLNDFLTGRNRQPDAELTLRLLHWLAEKRAGRDHSV